MRALVQVLVFAPVLLVGLLGACGGGGGTGSDPRLPLPPSLTTFRGTYTLVSVMGRMGSGDGPTVSALCGTAIVDGRGTATLTVENVRIEPEGMVIDPDPDPSGERTFELAYTEDAARGLSLIHSTSGGDLPLADGSVSSDGQYAVLSAQEEGQMPSVFVFARRDAYTAEDALLGAWQHAYWGTAPEGEPRTAMAGEAVTRASGALDLTVQLSNQDGAVSTDPTTYDFVWTGTEAGDMTLSLGPGAASSHGGLGGDVILTAGWLDTDVNRGVHLWAFTREGSGLSASSFDGSYVAIGFGTDPVTGEYRCSQGRLDADGISAVGLDEGLNIEGLPLVTFSVLGSFTLSPNGALSVSLGGQGEVRGGLVPSGAFAVLAGGGAAGSRPSVYFLMRP